MQEFENAPEIIAIKDILREFFMGIIENIRGAFLGFGEWIVILKTDVPPVLKLLGNSKVNAIAIIAILVYMVIVNIKTYMLFKADKRYASQGEERVPEWRLLTNLWMGGAIGGGIAMYRHRHKTKHRLFTVSAAVCIFLYIVLCSFIIGYLGFWTL